MDRRAFLRAAAGTAAAVSLVPSLGTTGHAAELATPVSSERKAKHVVLVAFAGGVRSRDTFGTPQNVPTLKALADEGVLYPRAKTSNLGHFGAALSIFTGVSEQRGIRENARGLEPTVFEYLRKDLGLSANDVWITTSGGPQQVNYSYGLHAEYGERFGANTLDGEGVFNKEFKRVLEALGRPKEVAAHDEELLTKLRASLSPQDGQSLNSVESAAQVERYILQELTRGTADLTGQNSGDAKALRVARNLITLFRPKLTAIVLQDADVAHGSYNGYVEVIRRNDAALGELVKAIRDDAQLASTTAIVVLPEFGRDRDLNSRRGLDHGDGSEELGYVSCLCWGPDFKRGQVVKDDVQVIDVVPTVCELLGAKARYARGKRLTGLFG
jgi:hypothetical protein